MIEQTLLPGEAAINNAPSTQLSNGSQCIPQHYLRFDHSYQSVSLLIIDIEYDDRYPVFVCEDNSGLYIQVGIIGFDNYGVKSLGQRKIVYGRKWRVEPELPTSEIIQTVFLALKKSREHEVRELFRLAHSGRSTTPFNNHLDLPVMARQAALFRPESNDRLNNHLRNNRLRNSHLLNNQLLNNEDPYVSEQDATAALHATLKTLSYDGANFELLSLQQLPGQLWFTEIGFAEIGFAEIRKANHQQPGLSEQTERSTELNKSITLLLNSLERNHLYYQLMEALIARSDRHVDENFRYRGFARFSQNNDIEAMANLSLALRRSTERHQFLQQLEQANYQTDLTRVPRLDDSPYGKKVRSQIDKYQPLDGILPK